MDAYVVTEYEYYTQNYYSCRIMLFTLHSLFALLLMECFLNPGMEDMNNKEANYITLLHPLQFFLFVLMNDEKHWTSAQK